MNKFALLAIVAFASTAAMAQQPSSAQPRTAAEQNAPKSGGMAAEKAQAKTDMKKDGTPTAMTGTTSTQAMATTTGSSRYKAMDTNGDGYVSQAEWNAYHGGMWKKMKRNDKGMASMTDIEAAMMSGGSAGGPN